MMIGLPTSTLRCKMPCIRCQLHVPLYLEINIKKGTPLGSYPGCEADLELLQF